MLNMSQKSLRNKYYETNPGTTEWIIQALDNQKDYHTMYGKDHRGRVASDADNTIRLCPKCKKAWEKTYKGKKVKIYYVSFIGWHKKKEICPKCK